MRLRIKYDLRANWLGKFYMGKYRGKMRYPFVFFAEARPDVTDRLFRHELQHVYQLYRR